MPHEKKGRYGCGIFYKYISPAVRFLVGDAIDSLFNQDAFIKEVLTPRALENEHGLAFVRVGPWMGEYTRHLAVVVPKSNTELDTLLREVETQPDGRSILNPFASMVGQTLSNNTGEYALKERQKLVNFTGNVPLFYPIIQKKFKETLHILSVNETSFVLLDVVKLLMRQITAEGMIDQAESFTEEENKSVNLGFKAIKSKLLYPYSIPTTLRFYYDRYLYRAASKKFINKHMLHIQDGLNHPKVNVLADIVRDNKDLKKVSIGEKSKHSMLVVGAMDGVYINLVGILLQLIQYPEVVEKLREELDLKCETDASGYKTLKHSDLTNYEHNPTYLDRIIKEGLRYISSAPIIPRYTSVGIKNGNIKIPPYTTILINLECLQHDKRFWGNDADVFNPERWSEDNIKDIKRFKDEHFLPFSTGPRPCPGSNVGLLCLRSFISELFLNYNLNPEPNQAPPGIDKTSALIMDIGPGYKVSIQKRTMLECEDDNKSSKDSLKRR